MATKSQTIEARCPVRIDLAGGTLDLWPISVLVPGSRTVNLGISLFAKARVSVTPQRKKKKGSPTSLVRYESKDQSHVWEGSIDALAQFTVPPALEIHHRAFRYFSDQQPRTAREYAQITIRTEATSPAGAGLGGSSAILIATLGALAELFMGKSKAAGWIRSGKVIEVAKDLESQVLRIPAGVQDYFGAAYGGLQDIAWIPGGERRGVLPTKTLKAVASRLVLFYSGLSRNSGLNNWTLYKDAIDQRGPTLNLLQNIAVSAQELSIALQKENWEDVGKAIASEWRSRKELVSSMATPEMLNSFEQARGLGASAWKVCGAGGGGCFFVYFNEPPSAKTISDLNERIQRFGPRRLLFQAVADGLITTRR